MVISGNGTYVSPRTEKEKDISERLLKSFLMDMRDYLITNLNEIKQEQAIIKLTQQEFASGAGSELQKISRSLVELKSEVETLKQLNVDSKDQANAQLNKSRTVKIATPSNPPTQQPTPSPVPYFASFLRSYSSYSSPPPRVLVVRTYKPLENVANYLNKEARKTQANIEFVDYFITPSLESDYDYSPKEYKVCVFTFFCGVGNWAETLRSSWIDQYKTLKTDFAVCKLLCLQESYINQNAPSLDSSLEYGNPPISLVYYNEKINAENSEVISKFIKTLVQELKKLQ